MFFDNDLAYFRTKYYRLRLLENPEQSTDTVPDLISKYTKVVDTDNGNSVRKSMLEIFEEIIIKDNYKNYLRSQSGMEIWDLMRIFN